MNLIDRRTLKAVIFVFREIQVDCVPAGFKQVVLLTGGRQRV